MLFVFYVSFVIEEVWILEFECVVERFVMLVTRDVIFFVVSIVVDDVGVCVVVVVVVFLGVNMS